MCFTFCTFSCAYLPWINKLIQEQFSGLVFGKKKNTIQEPNLMCTPKFGCKKKPCFQILRHTLQFNFLGESFFLTTACVCGCPSFSPGYPAISTVIPFAKSLGSALLNYTSCLTFTKFENKQYSKFFSTVSIFTCLHSAMSKPLSAYSLNLGCTTTVLSSSEHFTQVFTSCRALYKSSSLKYTKHSLCALQPTLWAHVRAYFSPLSYI